MFQQIFHWILRTLYSKNKVPKDSLVVYVREDTEDKDQCEIYILREIGEDSLIWAGSSKWVEGVLYNNNAKKLLSIKKNGAIHTYYRTEGKWNGSC